MRVFAGQKEFCFEKVTTNTYSNDTSLLAGTDLNTVVTAGLYDVAQPVNGPGLSGAFYLEVLVSAADTSFAMQRLTQLNPTALTDLGPRIFVRTQQSGSWSHWVELYTQVSHPGIDAGAVGPQGPIGPQGPAGPQGSLGPQGAIGTTGRIGPAGPQGSQGPIGPQGPVGVAGPQGIAGPAGETGPVGATGPQGPQGETGVAGPMGPAGLTGPAGAQGDAGPAGPKGDTGDVGPQGPAGETGPAGPQGDAGPVGAKGDTGDVGPQGLAGASGAAGPAGPQGEVGPQGPQGPAGAAGETGPAGPAGEIGPVGPTGPQGPAGEKGDAGIGVHIKGSIADPAALPTADATSGDTYIVSASGDGYKAGDGYTWDGSSWLNVGPIQGPAGPTGETGPVGPAGPQGEAGPKGDTGAVGPAGEVGPAGPQGEVGPTGAAGETGPAGEKGETGPAGAIGETGPAGPAGETGPKGETGDVGPQGPAGEKGDTGPAGPKGDTGAVGPVGATGPMGPTGAQGPQGVQGPAGPGLAFTPVQQGGGIGQGSNKINIGYSTAGKLKVSVDGTDLGALVFEGQSTGGSATDVDVAALSKAINARAGLYNVVDYGAVANVRDADTMTANVAAFQAAFDDIRTAKGGTLVIPDGNFTLNAQIGGNFDCDVGVVGTTQHSGLLFADMQDQNGLVLHAPAVRFSNMRAYADNAPNIGQGSLIDLETTGEFRGVVVHDVMLQGSPSARPGCFLNIVNAAAGHISGITIEGGANESYGSQSTGIAISANTLATDIDINNAKIFRVYAGVTVVAGNIPNVPTFEGISFTDCNLVGVQYGVQISSGYYPAPGLGWKGGHINAQKFCFNLSNYAQFSVSDAVLYMECSNSPQAHVYCNGCYSIGVKDCYFGYVDVLNSGARPAVTGVAVLNSSYVQVIGNEFSFGLVPSSNAIWNQGGGTAVRAAFNMRTGATSNGVGFVGNVNAMVGNDGV